MHKDGSPILAVCAVTAATAFLGCSESSSAPRPVEGIVVTAPSPVYPGSALAVTVSAAPGLTLQQVAVSITSEYDYGVKGTVFYKVSGEGPWRVSFPLPEEVIGEIRVFATGKKPDEKASSLLSNTIRLPVNLGPARLVSLRLLDPAGCTADPTYSWQTVLNGKFSDGVERNCSSVKLGTSYVSSDPRVVRVTEKGDVVCLREGRATLTASYGGQQATLRVSVRRTPGP